MTENLYCIYCNSTKVIRFGKTSNNCPRFRCKSCGKTWIIKDNHLKLDIWKVADYYLAGKSYRELIKFFNKSPGKLNSEIRDFLEGCPRWEDYLDAVISEHNPKVLVFTNLHFCCKYQSNESTEWHLLLAIDMHSSLVIGYEISKTNTYDVWHQFIERLKSRINNVKYILTGAKSEIDNNVRVFFPNSKLIISYHKVFRDKELNCCLNKINVDEKMIEDAISVFKSFKNKNLLKIFELNNVNELKKLLYDNKELFIDRLKSRLSFRLQHRLDNFILELQNRLEHFHIIRDNPEPIINGLIARLMLVNKENGFSRLSYYCQIPLDASLSDFSCARLPKSQKILPNSYQSLQFIIEIMARSLELPVMSNNCELEITRCQLL